MRTPDSLIRRFTPVCIVASALLAAAPAGAVPVTGTFTAQIIRIDGDDVAAAPFFPDQALLTGEFGYDTDAAVDTDPAPDRGLYTFDETAFMSISISGATYRTDPTLGPTSVSLSIFPGNQSFVITGGLVPQEDVPLATADVPLSLTLVNGLADSPLFLPSDALPTSDFSLATFSDPNGLIGGAGATPYLVFFQLRSLSITTASAIPEPGALSLLGLGMLALAAKTRRAG
jgi:PEP-CTERM motif